MPSTEVQRTLVKSPPELWAELSDPAALARHLGELGEIQLTRVEPESAVEWEAENVKGSVQLKASGWGTKVTFSLTRELPEQAVAEPEPAVAEPAQTVAEPEQTVAERDSTVAEPEPTMAEPEPVTDEPDLPEPDPKPGRTPRRGFFARLFKRRRKEQASETPEPSEALSEPDAPLAVEPIVEAPQDEESPAQATQELQAEATQEPQTETTAEPPALTADPPDLTAAPPALTADPPDLTAELQALEQAMVEQDTALLTAVLDRLGAAHHRPFSRG